jgi:CubicO group peptidase (beta-lactamase class C family)
MGVDVEAVLAQHAVPGCSLAVLDAGEVLYEAGHGTSRVGSGEPMTSSTRLPACSMSKPVAVVAALRLVERGVLDLDADVSDYLTRWTIPANGDWRPRLTIRQLASHTAGLTAHTGFPGYSRESVVPSLLEVLSGGHPANAAGARVDMMPGVQFRYSGVGTTLIQLVMEEVTGTNSAELLQQLVLGPTGMSASTFDQGLDTGERAHGHLPGHKPVPGGWRVQPEECAAGLWTTPGDYLRFMRAIQRASSDDPDTPQNGLLTRASAQELLTPAAALPSAPDMTGMSHIGLGFFVAAPNGVPEWFGHTGSNVGFVCASAASVLGRRGVVVMTNSDEGAPVVRRLLQSVAETLHWDDIELGGRASQDPPASIVAHAGTYTSERGLSVELADDGGTVALVVSTQPAIQLHFQDPTTLSTERLDLRVLLEPDGSISLEQAGRHTKLRRVT